MWVVYTEGTVRLWLTAVGAGKAFWSFLSGHSCLMYRAPASHRSCDKFLVIHLKVTKGVEKGKVPHLFFVF